MFREPISRLIIVVMTLAWPLLTIAAMSLFALWNGDIEAGEIRQVTLFAYGIAIVCSSWVLWVLIGLVMIGTVTWSLVTRRLIPFIVGQIAAFATFALPIILLSIGVIEYCGP